MSRSVNKVTLLGNLGNDPEVRTTTGGRKVATCSLATSRTWSDASGTKQEKTEWHRLVIWNGKQGGLADVVERYVKKGDKLYVEGAIEYRQWQDKDGQTRYSTEINVKELVLVSSRGEGQAHGGQPARGGQGQRSTARAATVPAGGDEFEDFPGALSDKDDDLPF